MTRRVSSVSISGGEANPWQARWTAAAFESMGCKVGPATGTAPADRTLEWAVPSGCLPTRSLVTSVRDAAPCLLASDRGSLAPGRNFRAAVAALKGQPVAVGRVSEDGQPGTDNFAQQALVNPFSAAPWRSMAGPTRREWRSRAWEVARLARGQWRSGRSLTALGTLLRGLPQTLANRREDLADFGLATMQPDPDANWSVTYVLDRLVIAGGVLSVIQLVNELVLRGVDARIACLFEDPAIYRWQPLLVRPMVFRHARELLAHCPPSDIAVATLWKTAPWVRHLVAGGRARESAYFVQDFEPWFFPARAKQRRRQVRETYGLIPHRIVKTDWLAQRLAAEGYDSVKIPLGLNLDVFRPDQSESAASPPSLLAMARPGTARRGFDTLADTIECLRSRQPELRFELFGARRLPGMGKERVHNHGVIDAPDRLAECYRRATLFLDTSRFQGFGRCALEAMASGTPCVLSAGGGVAEYARDGDNCLLVEDHRPESYALAVVRVLNDPQLREKLRRGGLASAANYGLDREVDRTRAYFKTLIGKAPPR